MENTPDNVTRLWMSQLDERLRWLEASKDEMTLDDKTVLVNALDHRLNVMMFLVSEIKRSLADDLEVNGWNETLVSHEDGDFIVERHNRARRSEIQREDLLNDVKQYARQEKGIDHEHGGDYREVTIELIEKIFRLEPRWTEVKKIGLDPDEYAISDWSTTVNIKQVHRSDQQ